MYMDFFNSLYAITLIKDAGVPAYRGPLRARAPPGHLSHGGVRREPLGGAPSRPICHGGGGDPAGRSMMGGQRGMPRATVTRWRL